MEKYNEQQIDAVAKVKCLRSSLFFTRYFFKCRFHRKFVVGEHHETICNALDKVLRGELTRLIINIAPRYGKTEVAVKNFIALGLGICASAKFIHLSYSASLALDNSEETKDFVTSDDYTKLFPEVVLKKDSKSKQKWYTTAGGGVYATSSSGQVTGFGAGKVDEDDNDNELGKEIDEIGIGVEGFGGAIIIDDPIKPEDAYSDTIRTKINNRFDSTIVNRVNSRKTPIIVIMQRVHPNDLTGHLLESYPGEWTVISLPCIKEDGEALWPFKHTLPELKKMQETNSIVFGSQYMQNPKPKEGLMYQNLKFYQVLPVEKYKTKAVIDTADTGEDFLIVWVYNKYSFGYYIIDYLYTSKPMEYTEPETTRLLNKHCVDLANIESNNGGRSFARAVEKQLRELGNTTTKINWYHQSKNKQARIYTNSAKVQNMVFFPEWMKGSPVMKHIENYTATGKNDHDDAEDGLTMIIEAEEKKVVKVS